MFFSLAAVEVGTHLYWSFAGFTVHGQVLLVTWLVIATILAIAIAGTLKLEQIPKDSRSERETNSSSISEESLKNSR